jgi:uncharacterized protein YjgD (DUF1641 family)
MTMTETDRIAELEHKLDAMSAQLTLVAEEAREQRLRRQQWDELRSDLAPIAGEAMQYASRELESVQEFVQLEDITHLLRRILRNTKHIEEGMARYESLMDFVDTAGPLAHEAFGKLLAALEEFERRGYFEFAKSSMGIVDSIVTNYTKDDVDALGDNVVQILDTVKSLTQPEMLIIAERALAAAKRQAAAAELEPAVPPSLFALMKMVRDEEVRRGMARALNTFKAVSAAETEVAAETLKALERDKSPEGGA